MQLIMAAIIAVLAIAAIVPHFVYNSKGGSAYVQVDTATYNALVRDNDSLKVTLDSIMFIHSKVASDISKEVTNQLRRRALIDSVYKVIDNKLDTLYAERISTADLVPYEEFASPMITIPYNEVMTYCNFTNITDDPELIQLFQTFFDTRNMEHFNAASEKIRSKPSFFNAAASFLVTEVPAGIPNSSPIATRIAGATCTTTVLFSSLISSHTSLMYDFSVRAPVGQTATHCPQNVH